MQDSILLEMYNAYKKENKIDFGDVKTKYSQECYELRGKLVEIIPFDLYDAFEALQKTIRKDEQEKFEEEKKLLLRTGMRIGLEATPHFIRMFINEENKKK